MAFTLGPGATGDKFAAAQDVGTDIVIEINGDLRTISGSTDAYGSLAQGALSTTPTALLAPASGTDMIVDSISLYNTGASIRTITFYKTKNSTTYTSATQWGPKIKLLPTYSAQWTGTSGWIIYDVNGTRVPFIYPTALVNCSVSAQGAGFATDTYLIGSNITMPSGYPTQGTVYRCRFSAAKTAAGTATPILTLRYGTNGSVADAARCTFTFTAGTAAVDTGWFEVMAGFRTVGSGTSAILQGCAKIVKVAAATAGFVNLSTNVRESTSAGFDSTPAGSILGLSVNGGLSAAWTVQLVQTEVTFPA